MQKSKPRSLPTKPARMDIYSIALLKEKTVAGTKWSSPTFWSKLSTLSTSLISFPSRKPKKL